MKYRLNDFPVYGVTSDFPLASIGFTYNHTTVQCVEVHKKGKKNIYSFRILKIKIAKVPMNLKQEEKSSFYTQNV